MLAQLDLLELQGVRALGGPVQWGLRVTSEPPDQLELPAFPGLLVPREVPA